MDSAEGTKKTDKKDERELSSEDQSLLEGLELAIERLHDARIVSGMF